MPKKKHGRDPKVVARAAAAFTSRPELQKYAQQQSDSEAAECAYTALLLLECTHDDRANRFLFGYVLRSMLSAFEEILFGNGGEE